MIGLNQVAFITTPFLYSAACAGSGTSRKGFEPTTALAATPAADEAEVEELATPPTPKYDSDAPSPSPVYTGEEIIEGTGDNGGGRE